MVDDPAAGRSTACFGTWLIKREGGRAWAALRTALESGRMPARELADGALILVGGTLMLSPGFVTDAFGILLILPFTRPVARRLLTAASSAPAAGRAVPERRTPRTGIRGTRGPGRGRGRVATVVGRC